MCLYIINIKRKRQVDGVEVIGVNEICIRQQPLDILGRGRVGILKKRYSSLQFVTNKIFLVQKEYIRQCGRQKISLLQSFPQTYLTTICIPPP